MGDLIQFPIKKPPKEKLRISHHRKQKQRTAVQSLDPQAIEALYRPEETGEPDEFNTPHSTCCGAPPLDHVQLCSICRDHCGWYEGEDE